jgi:diguanylate cyclase (GGDEF)-like protein
VPAAILAGYLISLVARTPAQLSAPLDGWGVAGFEVMLAVLCFARAVFRPGNRALALVLGAALLSWALGDVTLAAESSGGAPPPSPSLADAFYLSFYPLAYTAIVLLLMRRGLGRPPFTTWLDGAVAGLGAATLCAWFAVGPIFHITGDDPADIATNLAYPVGDVLLLALVIAGTAILPSRRRAYWVLLAAACAINAVGDTFNLFHGASLHVGMIIDGVAWPAATLMMSLSVWLVPARSDAAKFERLPGFVLPGLGAVAGLAALFAGSFRHLDPSALGLAVATLLAVGVRLVLSVRGLRAVTEERHRQAVTDELTGLGNRRGLTRNFDEFFAAQRSNPGAGRTLAFLFIDLNHFKEVNDSFGHAAGDELLRTLGPRLRGSLRGGDVLARIGGDELGVVLTDADAAYATTVAERLAVKLEDPFVLGAVRVRITASIGIAVAPADATDSAGLMRCADAAMYRAKASGERVEMADQDAPEAEDRTERNS